MAKNIMQNDPHGPFGQIDQLTFGERVALAAASVAIHELPLFLQQASDAADMQDMLVDPSRCWRGGFILEKALAIFNSYSGIPVKFLNELGDADSSDLFRHGCEELIARAIEQSKISASGDQHFDNGTIVTSASSPSIDAESDGQSEPSRKS
jgi:hypothetical protein